MPKIKPQRVLYVEPHDDVRGVVKRGLERAGIITETARDFQEGIFAFKAEEGYSGLDNYQAILLDFNLSKTETGSELGLTAINAGFPARYPIVIFSGYSQEQAKLRDPQVSKFRYLQKPATIEQIIDAISREE